LLSIGKAELDVISGQIGAAAAVLEAKQGLFRVTAWRQKAKAMVSENGGRLAHRWIKGAVSWVASPLDAGGPVDQQTEADLEASSWHNLWGAHEVGEELDWSDIAESDVIRKPNNDEVLALGMSFSKGTGLGVDQFNPRVTQLLSEVCLAALGELLFQMIRIGRVPSAAALLLMVLIPKEALGKRPIGLFAGLARMASRWIRRCVSELWEAAHARVFFFGGKGASCEKCVWRFGIHSELAVAQGRFAGAVLLDLWKAYETVKHWALKRAAVRHGFSLRALRFLLRTYRLPRTGKVGAVCTRVVRASATIVAGCSNATTLLRLLLLSAADAIAAISPALRLGIMVDDFQMEADSDTEGGVVELLRRGEEVAIREVEGGCQLKYAEDKRQLVVSSAGLATRLGQRNRDRKALRSTVRNLGLDYACGKHYGAKVRWSRFRKIRGRLRRVCRLRAAGAPTRRLVTSGLQPAMLWGAGVTGMNNTCLAFARRVTRQGMVTKTAGRSLTLDLIMAGDGVDPIFRVSEEPLKMWLGALWNGSYHKGDMLRTLSTAIAEVQESPRPWSRVKGPAGALVATVGRLGWSFVDVVQLRTHRGVVQLLEESPASVIKLMHEACELWQWQQVVRTAPELGAIQPLPAFDQLRTLLRAKPKAGWTPVEQGYLRSAICGGQWSPLRKFRAGMLPSPQCGNCGHVGTDGHRVYRCDGMRDHVDLFNDPGLMALQASHPQWLVWARALVPDPAFALPAPIAVRHVIWTKPPADGWLRGQSYGDGAGLFRALSKRAERCGFGVVAMDGIHCVAVGHGPVPGFDQNVPLAESLSFLVALENHGPGLVDFATDCQLVQDAWRRGRAWSTDGFFVLCGVWRLIWDRIDDIGAGGVVVRKVRSHLRRAQIGILISEADFEGNRAADLEAKAGAGLHAVSGKVLRTCFALKQLQKRTGMFIGQALARYGRELPRDSPDYDSLPKPRGGAIRKSRAQHAVGSEAVAWDEACGRWRCAACQRSATTRTGIQRLECAAEQLYHHMMSVGPYRFCASCGAYTAEQTIRLKAGCLREPASSSAKDRRNRLLKGRDPITRVWLGTPVDLGRAAAPVAGVRASQQVSDPQAMRNSFVRHVDELEMLLEVDFEKGAWRDTVLASAAAVAKVVKDGPRKERLAAGRPAVSLEGATFRKVGEQAADGALVGMLAVVDGDAPVSVPRRLSGKSPDLQGSDLYAALDWAVGDFHDAGSDECGSDGDGQDEPSDSAKEDGEILEWAAALQPVTQRPLVPGVAHPPAPAGPSRMPWRVREAWEAKEAPKRAQSLWLAQGQRFANGDPR